MGSIGLPRDFSDSFGRLEGFVGCQGKAGTQQSLYTVVFERIKQ